MKKIAVYFFSALLAMSCIYPYEADLESIDGTLVIEGDIILGTVSTFRLSRVQPVDGVYRQDGLYSAFGNVWVEDDQGGIYRSTGGGGGYLEFVSSSGLQVDLTEAPGDRNYRLHVSEYMTGKTYVSDWRSPQMAPIIEDISFEVDETDNMVLRRPDGKARVSMRAADGASRYFRWDYEEEWQYHANYYIRYRYNFETEEYEPEPDYDPNYWCWTKSSSTEAQIAIAIGDDQNQIKDHVFLNFNTGQGSKFWKKFGVHIIARGISEECYQYLHTLEQNSNSSGDLFTPNPSELRGNITCEDDPDELVLGFIEVSRTSDRYGFLPDGMGAYLDRGDGDPAELIPLDAGVIPTYYANGWRVIDNVIPQEGPSYYGWAPPQWCDCRYLGGTNVKPSYWED